MKVNNPNFNKYTPKYTTKFRNTDNLVSYPADTKESAEVQIARYMKEKQA